MAITMHSHAAVEKSGNKPTPQDAYAALSNAVDCDLLTRTSWTDARLALHQIKKVILFNSIVESSSAFFLFCFSTLDVLRVCVCVCIYNNCIVGGI